jgi:hypothetical protein
VSFSHEHGPTQLKFVSRVATSEAHLSDHYPQPKDQENPGIRQSLAGTFRVS